eukprot:11206345-Lingulodinium_polyedra.AAC.1
MYERVGRAEKSPSVATASLFLPYRARVTDGRRDPRQNWVLIAGRRLATSVATGIGGWPEGGG